MQRHIPKALSPVIGIGRQKFNNRQPTNINNRGNFMGLNQVVPGRYTAQIKDWGLREVPQLDNAIEAWISFEFKDQAEQLQTINWKGLVLTKAGARNKKTATTIETCGYKHGEDLMPFMDQGALDMATPVDITIIDEMFGDKVYKNVEWVNAVGDVGGGTAKATPEQAKSIQDKLIKSGLGKPKAKVKNHAPQSTGQADTEKLPF
jgi:hypothetical protein